MSPSREGLLRLTRPAASVFQERLFLLLSGVFIAALVASNLIFQKFFTWTPFGLYTFEISVGILPYPVTFLVTDIVSEIYGRKRADQVVVSGFFASLFILLVVLVMMVCLLFMLMVVIMCLCLLLSLMVL